MDFCAYNRRQQKTMNNIKNDVDVLDWAKTISDGKGEKYIPLGKGDMYVIAKFVLANAQCMNCPPLVDENGEPKLSPASPTADAQQEQVDVGAGEPKGDEYPEFAAAKQIVNESSPKVNKVTMTRGYALHHAQFTTQQAYDKFLDWCKEHPKEGSVMDFSTGKKSSEAAFAYWLMENIVVEIPR